VRNLRLTAMDAPTASFRNSLQAALLATQRSRERRDRSISSTQSIDGVEDLSARNSIGRRESIGKHNLVSNGSNAEPMTVSTIAVSMLDASSLALRKAIGSSLSGLLAQKHNEHELSPQKASQEDLQALIQLATSGNSQLQSAACEWISENVDSLPRGKLPVKTILQKVTAVLDMGKDAEDSSILEFALRVGLALANEGETWAKRMVSDELWDDRLCSILFHVREPDVAILTLKVCAVLAQVTTANKYVPGCIRLLNLFSTRQDVVSEVCLALAKNQPPIEDEPTLSLFLQLAANASNAGDFKLVCDSLKVIRAQSHAQAKLLTQLFEDTEIMATLNALYRSQTFGSKLECALFFEAIVSHLRNDADAKVRLCESGAIIRLIRLASPIVALTELALVERIGARIVLAGGLGPLFSHANSSRPTRPQAKKALQALVS